MNFVAAIFCLTRHACLLAHDADARCFIGMTVANEKRDLNGLQRQQNANQDMVDKEEQSSQDTSKFLRAWAWKREHRPDKVRFHRPYTHVMACPDTKLVLKQSKFEAEGFASTVWDSSIVMAKYFERWSDRWSGKRCLDLSAGCGLVGIVLARLGAHVILTDLLPNLPLLVDNCKANVPDDEAGSATVQEHRWGQNLADLGEPFDVIVACDVMYIADAIPNLVKTLSTASSLSTDIYISHGRNRQAEDVFMCYCEHTLDIRAISNSELDEVYQTIDVDVLHLNKV